ncbi:hypothetical protein D3C81_1829050 [compost metagenome]
MGFPAQVAQLARQFEAEADLGRCLLLDTGIQLIRAHPQAGHIAIALGADGQFGFVIGIEQGRQQRFDPSPFGQVQQAHAATHGFVGQGATKAPQRRIGEG